jgi:hypothetical protein
MTLRLGTHTTYPITRFDVEQISKKIDLTKVTVVDCRGCFAMSHSFADELFKRIGHTAEIKDANQYVKNVIEAGHASAKPHWNKASTNLH